MALKFRNFHQREWVWKLRKFTVAHFRQTFRENNLFTKEIPTYIVIVDLTNFLVRVISPHKQCNAKTMFLRKIQYFFSSNQRFD